MTKRPAIARREEAPGGRHSKRTPNVGGLAELDQLLEIRERLVVVLDAIDQDDIDGARFYGQELLEDFDREVQR
jgi:hypothetical protein